MNQSIRGRQGELQEALAGGVWGASRREQGEWLGRRGAPEGARERSGGGAPQDEVGRAGHLERGRGTQKGWGEKAGCPEREQGAWGGAPVERRWAAQRGDRVPEGEGRARKWGAGGGGGRRGARGAWQGEKAGHPGRWGSPAPLRCTGPAHLSHPAVLSCSVYNQQLI